MLIKLRKHSHRFRAEGIWEESWSSVVQSRDAAGEGMIKHLSSQVRSYNSSF